GADRHRGGRDADRGAVGVVAPHAHVPAAAFGLDAVIHGVHRLVAVDVAVGAGEALVRVVVAAADRVHVVVLVPGRAVHLVVADDVVSSALVHRDAVRAGGVSPVPAVRAVARVVDLVALDHDAVHLRHVVVAARRDARVLVQADRPAARGRGAIGAPAAHVVVLDHDVVLAGRHQDAVTLGALDVEPAHDHV